MRVKFPHWRVQGHALAHGGSVATRRVATGGGEAGEGRAEVYR
jgi:hypothetical protein